MRHKREEEPQHENSATTIDAERGMNPEEIRTEFERIITLEKLSADQLLRTKQNQPAKERHIKLIGKLFVKPNTASEAKTKRQRKREEARFIESVRLNVQAWSDDRKKLQLTGEDRYLKSGYGQKDPVLRLYTAYSCVNLAHLHLWNSDGCFDADASRYLELATVLFFEILKVDWNWIFFLQNPTCWPVIQRKEGELPDPFAHCSGDDKKKIFETADPIDFFNLLCSLGKILMNPRNPLYNVVLAALLFKAGCDIDDANNAAAVFWYGRCMKLGLGVKMDPQQAVLLMQEAASRGLQRAMFALGIIFETGYFVTKNIPLAAVYYAGACRVSPRQTQARHNQLGPLSFRVFDGFEDDFVETTPDLHQAEDLREESVSRDFVLQATVHAFLFAAAAALAPYNTKRYHALPRLLPILGCFFSAYACTAVGFTWHRNCRRFHPMLWRLERAKKAAFRSIYSGETQAPGRDDRNRRSLVLLAFRMIFPLFLLGCWFWLAVYEFLNTPDPDVELCVADLVASAAPSSERTVMLNRTVL